MTLHRKMTFTFFLFIISIASYSQLRNSNTLLWRISGHGLQKPSYLFGTMHLNDKRLFLFGDSVYHAIEQTEGLAIELSPDEMGAYYVNKLFDQFENSKKLEEVLKENDFKKYSAALEKKFHKPAGEITTSDVVKEKNKWMADYMEKGEMPTFVDAFLYNVARRQGKWVGGIEDMADQAGLLEDLVDKSDINYLLMGDSATHSTDMQQSVDRMIDLYTSQDLERLGMVINGQTSPNQHDRLLINRNVKMARRMDSLINLRTMFLAVGAAHLPGDSGVIYLLRKRGFIVEPVISSRKMDAKDYTFKDVHLPWFSVDDTQGLYHASMPGNPATVKLFGLVEMKFLLDIFNMSGFCTMAVISPSDFADKDSIYSSMARRMFQGDALPAAKIINNNGISGREYTKLKTGTNIRLQLFLYNKVMYLSFMYAMKAGPLSSEDANKFFDGFTIDKTKSLTASLTTFTDSVMGVSFVAPAAVTYNKKLSKTDDNGWKITAFTGIDLADGAYVMLYSKELKPGHYVQSDTLIYNDFYKQVKLQYNIMQQDDRLLQGYKAATFTGRNILEPNLYMNALNVLRNGRDIVLITISDSTHLHAPSLSNVFTSLQLTPHAAPTWQSYSAPKNIFSCQCPGPIRSYTDRTGKVQFFSYDTATSISYDIIPDTLSKYFWAKDDSSFWKKCISENLGDDSLVQKENIVNGDMPGIELLASGRNQGVRYKRMRLFLVNNKLYKLFVSAEKDFLCSSPVNNFFTSFRINTLYGNDHFITTSKTDNILRGIESMDSATLNDAYTGLAGAPFAEADRLPLQDALFKKYFSLYDSGVSTVINNEIVNKLAALNSAATVDFVKAHYLLFTARKDTLKNIGLSLLAQMHTKESYAVLAQLLQQSPPQEAFDYMCVYALKDSLGLTAGIYTALQQLAADTVHAASIANIANKLLDSGFVQQSSVQAAESRFVKAAQELLPALRRASGSYEMYQLVTLLGRFKNAMAYKTLTDYLSVKEFYLRKEAALQLIKNAQPVPAALLNQIAADRGMRHGFYTDLKNLKKGALFPAKYLTQAYFAESAVYNAGSGNDDDYPGSLAFLTKKTALYKNKRYVFYLYKVSYTANDEPAAYLGIAGGYDAAKMALEPAQELSGVYTDEPFDAKNINALLQNYLKNKRSYNDE